MLAGSQPGPAKPPSDDVDVVEIVKAKRELLYSSLACVIVFCLSLGCTLRGIVPAIYTVALGMVLSSAILVRLISINSSRSDSARQHANKETDKLSDEHPLLVWIGWVPVPMTRRGYFLLLVILIAITVIAGVVTTWIRHHIL